MQNKPISNCGIPILLSIFHENPPFHHFFVRYFRIWMRSLFLILMVFACVLCREYKLYKQLDCGGNDIRQEHTSDVWKADFSSCFMIRLKNWRRFAMVLRNVLVLILTVGLRRLVLIWSCNSVWICTWMLLVSFWTFVGILFAFLLIFILPSPHSLFRSLYSYGWGARGIIVAYA